MPSETNHRERTASAAPGRTGQGTQISEPYKSTRPPRLSVSPSLAKSSQVPSPNFPSRAQILAPLVCIPVLRGVPHSTYLYLNSLDSTCLPTPPRPPLPIQQSTNPPSHPPIINPGLIPRRPASRHPPAARFAQHGAPWGNCACILGRAATAPLLHSRRRLFASPSPRLASTSDHLRIQSCLAPACLLLIWSLSGVNRIRFLPRCKTSTAFARIRASASTSAPCCTLTPRRQLTSSSPRHLTGLSSFFLSVCRSGSHPRLLLLPGVLLYCRALKPTKQASHRIALRRSAPPSFNTLDASARIILHCIQLYCLLSGPRLQLSTASSSERATGLFRTVLPETLVHDNLQAEGTGRFPVAY